MRGLFIFWERIAKAAGSCDCRGLAVIRGRLGVGHELAGELATFWKRRNAGGVVGLQMEGDHLRTGQGDVG